MEDRIGQIREFFKEFNDVYLEETWVAHLIKLGFDDKTARAWQAEIYHVLAEFESRMRRLVRALEESDPERIPIELDTWAWGVSEEALDEIREPAEYLQSLLKEYLPPDLDEEDEDEGEI